MSIRMSLLVALASMGCYRATESTVKGAIATQDGRIGVNCGVEVNSTFPPLMIPGTVTSRSGERFEVIIPNDSVLTDMYVAVRCEGYTTTVSRPFLLGVGEQIDVGVLTVTKADAR
jgi:hypothetical protein